MNSALKAEDPKKNINVLLSSDIEDTKRRSSSNHFGKKKCFYDHTRLIAESLQERMVAWMKRHL